MAGIPMLSGWADGLSSLPQLGQNIANIMNPNSDIQHLFKQKVATDPNFLQNLANNPEAAKMLGSLGFGQNIQSSVSGIPVDQATQASDATSQLTLDALKDPQLRAIAQSVKVTGQTPSTISKEATQADIATATKGSTIAGINAASRKTVNDAKTSDQQLAMTEDTIKKIPTLAGVDLSQFAMNIVSGKPVDPILASRIAMDPGASTALADYQKAILNRMDIMSRQKIAEIQQNKPQNQLYFLTYAQAQQKQLNDQLNSADAFLKSAAAGNQEITWQSLAKSKDTSDQGKALATSAQANLDQLAQAHAALAPDSPLHKSLDKYNGLIEGLVPSLFHELGSGTGKPGLGAGGTGSSTKTTSSSTSTSGQAMPLLPQQINGFVQAIRSGQKNLADLNTFHAGGGMTDQDYQTIISQMGIPGAAGTLAPSVTPPASVNPFQIKK